MLRKTLFNSLLLSLLALFPISATEISQDMDVVSFRDLDKIDMTEATLEFSPELVSSNGIEEDISLLYDKDGFYIRTNENDVRVKAYDTDKLLRGCKVKDIAKYATLGKFKVSKFDNGEYTVHAQGGLKGGGVAGATIGAHIGMVATNVIGHGVLFFISSFSGPAAPAVYAGLAATYGPWILATSKAVAVGVGVAAGVATGPV